MPTRRRVPATVIARGVVERGDQVRDAAARDADDAAGARTDGVAHDQIAAVEGDVLRERECVPAGTTSAPSAGSAVVRVTASGMAKTVSPVVAPGQVAAVVRHVERAGGVEREAAERVEAGGDRGGAAAVEPDHLLEAGAERALSDEDGVALRTTPPCTVPGVGIECTAQPGAAVTAAAPGAAREGRRGERERRAR